MNRDEIILLFYDVLYDIRDYLPGLTLVGGWLPYVYSNHLWKRTIHPPVTTVDIDFGLGQSGCAGYSRTIYETLSSLGYKERHLSMDRNFPVVLYKESVPVEFITYPAVNLRSIEKIAGKEIHINKIDQFGFLLKHRIQIGIQQEKQKLTLYCPKPSAFLYHKAATYMNREYREKQSKDLYYMYFILRYAPDIENILNDVSQYALKNIFKDAPANLDADFSRIFSRGCLLVERENGPDDMIHDVRQDIFDRFKRFREAINQAGKSRA
ncbi:MAG: hypothetical protein JW860_12225 [Sedimentisphaerales bacterium]|nr:hypothetical protein [Sedimentisphaerales bacterium]